MSRLELIFAILLASGSLVSAHAAPFTLTFDELPFQLVTGLSYQGVTFGFTVAAVDSPDANYNSAGPGTLTYVQGAVLEGDASGVLILDFGSPTSVLQFGVALLTFDVLTPGLTVKLLDPSLVSIGTFSLNTSPLITFSEGQFVYGGLSLVRQAEIHYLSGDRFALDNLTYNAVPEPATVSFVLLGLASMLAARRRRRHRAG